MHTYPFRVPFTVETGPCGHLHSDLLPRQGFARQSFLRDYFPYTFNSRYRQIHIYAYIPASYSLCSRNGPCGHSHSDLLSRQGFARQSLSRDYFPCTCILDRQIAIYAYISVVCSPCTRSREGIRPPPASRPPTAARIREAKCRARASRIHIF